MIVSHRHEFIFVRPRKVAGTSIQLSLARVCGEGDEIDSAEVFDPRVDTDRFGPMEVRNRRSVSLGRGGHVLPDAIRESVGARVWDNYFKFTVLRNPFDLIVSYIYFKFTADWVGVLGRSPYFFRRPRYAFRHLDLSRIRRLFLDGDRKESVERILKREFFKYIHEIPEFYFLDGQEYADYYVRYENLQNDYDELCRRLRIPSQDLPRTKDKLRKSGDDYRDYYSDWSWKYVADLCREMIATWYPELRPPPPPSRSFHPDPLVMTGETMKAR